MPGEERFILLGHSDGCVSAWYLKNGAKRCLSSVSDQPITAVAGEMADQGIFYACDSKGNIVTLSNRG